MTDPLDAAIAAALDALKRAEQHFRDSHPSQSTPTAPLR